MPRLLGHLECRVAALLADPLASCLAFTVIGAVDPVVT